MWIFISATCASSADGGEAAALGTMQCFNPFVATEAPSSDDNSMNTEAVIMTIVFSALGGAVAAIVAAYFIFRSEGQSRSHQLLSTDDHEDGISSSHTIKESLLTSPVSSAYDTEVETTI